MFLVASLALAAAMLFMLWPLIRHSTSSSPDNSPRGGVTRESALLAIEEIELDHASGRLSSEQAEVRRSDAILRAEQVLSGKDDDPRI